MLGSVLVPVYVHVLQMTVNVVIFAGGKFRENVGKPFWG